MAQNQACPRLPGKQKHPSRVQRTTSGVQVAKETQESGNQLWQGDTQPGVCGIGLGKSAMADTVHGADRSRLASSWAQRVGASLCQQDGLAAGPCGVRPRRGRETIAGLGLRLWACQASARSWCEAGARCPCKHTHMCPCQAPKRSKKKTEKKQHARTRKPVSPLTVSLHGENILVLAAKRFLKLCFHRAGSSMLNFIMIFNLILINLIIN